MKVSQQTATELTLKTKPWMCWVVSSTFIVAGVIIPLSTVKSTLTCQRLEPNQGNCQLTKISFFQTTSQNIPLQDLQPSRVESSTSNDGEITYRVMLQLPDRGVKIFDCSYSTCINFSDRMNHFIQYPNIANFQAVQSDQPQAAQFFPIFIGIGALLTILLGTFVTYHFDRHLETLTIQKRGILGTKVIEYSLRNVMDVQVETSRSTDSDSSDTYRVSLILADGARIPLTHYYSSGWNRKKETADRIKAFLKL